MDVKTVFPVDAETLNLIAELDEFKGAWKALGSLTPDRLTALRHVATIESIGSSTRIEGSRLSNEEVGRLLSSVGDQTFNSRDEQEVVGYAAAMDMIFESWQNIQLTENNIRQLHRELLRHSQKDQWHLGEYKSNANKVVAFDADGNEVGVVFETASPFETPGRMAELIEWFNTESLPVLHPLIRIGIFVVTFLEIHPFQDGNGRLSRVLTTLLLLKAGYAYVPFASLESVIERSKDRYYIALHATQVTIRTVSPDWQPWLVFFLTALQRQKTHLQTKIEREKLIASELSALETAILDHVRDTGSITTKQAQAITAANRNTVKKALARLAEQRKILLTGKGRGARYILP